MCSVKGSVVSPVILRNKTGQVIRSVEEGPDSWLALAPPQEAYHWRDGYSAKELAKLWFCGGSVPVVPEPFDQLFGSADAIRGLQIKEAVCELVSRIDHFRGKHRHHDQILIGYVGERKTVVGVEAKAEEEFGPLIECYLEDPQGGGRDGSNIPARIELLAQSLFGKSTDAVRSLRYQLLHAFAGTLIEAKRQGADQSVFMVCEFVRKTPNADARERNHRDLQAFVQSLPKSGSTEVRADHLFGPIVVPGGKFVPAEMPAFIGKVTIDLD